MDQDLERGRLQQYSCIMIYGDPAYQNLDVVKRKSKGLRTLWQRVLDKSMQPSRATVEDAFAYLVITFPYFRNKIKFQLLRVAQASSHLLGELRQLNASCLRSLAREHHLDHQHLQHVDHADHAASKQPRARF